MPPVNQIQLKDFFSNKDQKVASLLSLVTLIAVSVDDLDVSIRDFNNSELLSSGL